MWNSIKKWFKNSETIFIARLETAVGFLVAALSAIDWTPLMSMDFSQAFSWNQFTVIGLMLIVKGLISEWARRRNATDL